MKTIHFNNFFSIYFLKFFRFECNKLRVLDVGHNQLSSIPREIKKLIVLKELYINNNNLSDLPNVIEECIGIFFSQWCI